MSERTLAEELAEKWCPEAGCTCSTIIGSCQRCRDNEMTRNAFLAAINELMGLIAADCFNRQCLECRDRILTMMRPRIHPVK